MSYALLSGTIAQATGTQTCVPIAKQGIVFRAILKGTAAQAVSATVLLYGSNDPLACGDDATNCAKELLATYSLSGTAAAGGLADSGVWLVTAPYSRFWGKVTAITGTGAAVYLIAST